jgi:hypothetical protein
MSREIIKDNIYKEGTIITARVDPGLKLKIIHYYQRIYYCANVDHPERKQLVYFEHELAAPKIETLNAAPISAIERND